MRLSTKKFISSENMEYEYDVFFTGDFTFRLFTPSSGVKTPLLLASLI